MSTFIRYAKAICFSIGWFIVFVMSQVFYTAFAFIFKIITDREYAISVQDLLQKATTGGAEQSANMLDAYIEIIGSLTSYLELFLVIGMLGWFIIDRQFHEYRFAFNKVSLYDIPLFISLGILMNILSTLFISMFSADTIESTGYDTSLMLQGGFVGVLLGVGIFAPVCEEITFRYFIYHNLNRGNQILAIIISAALFGVAHGNILQGMYAFTFGLVFVLINIRYNSIMPGIIMHISVNSLSVILMYITNPIVNLIVMVICFIVISLIALVCKVCQRSIANVE